MKPAETNKQLIAWGGYDTGKPRVRLLLTSLRENGATVREIHIPVWSGVEDKAVIGLGAFVWRLAKLAVSYPSAIVRLLLAPPVPILVPYPGIAEILMLWPIARLRRQPLILDAFIPLHDTITNDRALAAPRGFVGRILHAVESLALRSADIILVDTVEHGRFYQEEFKLSSTRIQTVLVGAEPLFKDARRHGPAQPQVLALPSDKPLILFYGQLIPLQGVSTILSAIALTAEEPFFWLIVGSGQQQTLVQSYFDTHEPTNAKWLPWLEYDRLPSVIRAATVGLGIFGTTAKAARVIPNKLFQVLHAGKPVITRSSPAVEHLAETYPQALITIPAGDAAALAEAVKHVVGGQFRTAPIPEGASSTLGPDQGVNELFGRIGFA